jgi:dihydropteroate synthase
MRLVEADGLRAALAEIEGVDADLLDAAGRLQDESVRALVMESVAASHRTAVIDVASGTGIASLEGSAASGPSAPLVLAGPMRDLWRMPDLLERRGLGALAAEMRDTLHGNARADFVLTFPDGGTMVLGRRSRVMGVLNVTPDSFSDGGRVRLPYEAVDAALRMEDDGADFVDVGGESTRPGAQPVTAEQEIRRVVPAIEAIRRSRATVRISVDTMKAEVALRALEAGADMINDVSALSDPAMPALLRDRGAPAVVMHMRGMPGTMQSDTRYADLVGEVIARLRAVLARASEAGIRDDRILVDPGVGFGKSAAGNLELVRQLPALRGLGRPILVGASRKSFIGSVLDLPVEERLEGSLAVAAIALWQGAHVVRAHDVSATCRVARMVDAIKGS